MDQTIPPDMAPRILIWQFRRFPRGLRCRRCRYRERIWAIGDILFAPAVDTAPRLMFALTCDRCGQFHWFDAAAEGVLAPPTPPRRPTFVLSA